MKSFNEIIEELEKSNITYKVFSFRGSSVGTSKGFPKVVGHYCTVKFGESEYYLIASERVNGYKRIYREFSPGGSETPGIYKTIYIKEESNSSKITDIKIKPFVVIDPYQSDELAVGIWSNEHNGYIFGDGDIYTLEQIQKNWQYAKYLTFNEIEEKLNEVKNN